MSKYNSYARELDKAFKEAREKYAELVSNYNAAKSRLNSANAQFKETYTGERAVKQARAKADFMEAEDALRHKGDEIWDSFMLNRKQLGNELAQAVKAGNMASPDGIDNNALELLKSGILTADEMVAMAGKYDSNPTMLRLIGKYAGEMAEKAERADRGTLYILADECKNGSGKVMRVWEDLVSATNYCSGIGAGDRRREAQFAVKMGEHWEKFTANVIENF